ncbi:MAG: carbohydrate ABC transporter permease [Chloroflexota bacterium]|jgi:multiple sugar transport system permease protein|nr:carbohydrate ABC transporter permease [Chloroflexota bacterium]
MRITSRPLIQRILVWLVLLGAALISLFPMYWLFVMALTPIGTIPPSEPYLVPSPFSFSNIARLLTSAKDYGRWAVNSIVIAVVVTLWHTIFDTMSGYAFAKRDFPGRNVLFGLILSTLMIPAQVTLVPTYVVTRQLGLLESDPLISINGFQLLSVNSLAVILPGLAAVFGVFLMRQYIQTLPSELEDAARIDGCSELQVFTNIILPLCVPAVAALSIFSFVRNWNDFLWPLIVLRKSINYTLTVGVAGLQGEFSTDYGIIFAGAALAALPMIIFFLMFQRYFIEGVRMGALKG